MAKKSILTEALVEARALKEAAIKNAENSLAGHFRESLEQIVNAQLNEEEDTSAGDDEDDECMEEGTMEHDPLGDEISETDELGLDDEEDDDLDFGGEDDGDEDLDDSEGFSEDELTEAIEEAMREILDEVDHGDLGEMGEIDPDTHDTGLMDSDSKVAGWQEKTAPHSKDWTVKESAYKRKIAKLVTENKALHKGMKKLRGAVMETNLFNKKMFCAHKLLKRPGLSESVRVKIIGKLDEAKTAIQVQNVYEAFETALGLVSESVKPKRKNTTTLSEALGSQGKSERGLTHVDDRHLINEDAKYDVRRMQLLAGLRGEEE